MDFENNFADFSTTDLQNLKEDVFQEAPFDKYAVFRELEQDDPAAGDTVEDNTETADFEDAVQDSIKEEAELPRSDSAMAEEGLRDEELEDYTEDGDKYAALREICSEDAEPQVEVRFFYVKTDQSYLKNGKVKGWFSLIHEISKNAKGQASDLLFLFSLLKWLKS